MTKIDPNKMMAQLGKMQQQMEKAQEELKTAYVEHSAGGGAVTVKVSGALEVAEITIKPEAIDPDDPEMLQDLLVSAGCPAWGCRAAPPGVRPLRRQPHRPALIASGRRPAHRPAARVPPAAGDSRGGAGAGGRDPRGEGADRHLRALLQPGRGSPVHHLQRRAPRSQPDLRRGGPV